jgi:hypothetical protein
MATVKVMTTENIILLLDMMAKGVSIVERAADGS